MALEYAVNQKRHGVLLEATIEDFLTACLAQAELVALVPAHYYKHNGPGCIDHDEVFKWYGWEPGRISPRIIRRFPEIVVQLKSAGRFHLPTRVIKRRTDDEFFWGGGGYHRSVWNSHHRESSLVKRKKRRLRKLERRRESIAAEIKMREHGLPLLATNPYLDALKAHLAELTLCLQANDISV